MTQTTPSYLTLVIDNGPVDRARLITPAMWAVIRSNTDGVAALRARMLKHEIAKRKSAADRARQNASTLRSYRLKRTP